jgi:hypothetical protein
MARFTLAELAAKTLEVAAEKPDYIYRSPNDDSNCLYWHWTDGVEGAPGCIFGHVLTRLGVDISDGRFEGAPINEVLGTLLDRDEDADDLMPFLKVQRLQDGDKPGGKQPWGQCITVLTEMYPAVAS